MQTWASFFGGGESNFMPPIELRVETPTGEKIAKGTIKERIGDHTLAGLTVQIDRIRRNGRGPNGNREHIKAALLRIPQLSTTGKWVNLANGEVTFRLPRSQERVKAKLV